VRLTTSLQVRAKYLGCVVCRFHVAVSAGSAPCQKPASINLQKLFLSPTGRLKPWFLTEEKLTVVLIIPFSWGCQLVVKTMHQQYSTFFSSGIRAYHPPLPVQMKPEYPFSLMLRISLHCQNRLFWLMGI
jgi:hypothetical protein